MTNKAWQVLILFFLCGCVNVRSTGVVPAGDDTYMVSQSGGMVTGTEIKADLFREANEYCQKKGKALKVVRETSRDDIFVRSASAEIRFKCQ